MKLRFPLALLGVVLVSAGIGWAISQATSSSSSRGLTQQVPPRHAAHHRSVPRLPRGWSYIAVARSSKLVVYHSPGHGSRGHGPRVMLTNALAAGARLSLLVRRRHSSWIQIYLPIRPDGATGWVPARAVKVLTTAYALKVQLGSHRLLLSVGRRVVRRFSIGVGTSVTPTPTGTYFITELLKQPDPTGPYGPFAFGLSAYSGVLTHFGKGGNGQIGIHGTNEPQLVGTNVSHGCIRLRNPDILWLRQRLPLGTPVSIERD